MSSYSNFNWELAPRTNPLVSAVLFYYPQPDSKIVRDKVKAVSPALSIPKFLTLMMNLYIKGDFIIQPQGADYVIRTADQGTDSSGHSLNTGDDSE